MHGYSFPVFDGKKAAADLRKEKLSGIRLPRQELLLVQTIVKRIVQEVRLTLEIKLRFVKVKQARPSIGWK